MGIFSFLSPTNWRAMGEALQLTAYAPTATYTTGISFRQTLRCRGVPAYGEPSFREWFHGVRRGVDVLVLSYETGSGSTSTTWTAAIARIDPPLLLGLSIKAQGFLDKLFGASDIQIGEAGADRDLDIRAFHAERIPVLLSPSDPACHDVLLRMRQLASNTALYVGDSLVEVSDQGTLTDPSRVAGLLDAAIDLAAWFAQRRRVVPFLASETAQHQRWGQFATARRFTFDPSRMKLVGECAGSLVEIALETDLQRVRTAVTVRFPREVHVGFCVTRSGWPGFLQGLFSQDIKVGDRAFDEAYKVTGHPEQAVRQVLARPALLKALVLLGQNACDIELNHREMFFRVEGASESVEQLDSLASLAATTSQQLFENVRDLGPFR